MPFPHYTSRLKAKASIVRRGLFAHRMPNAQYTDSIMTTWDTTVKELRSTMPSDIRLLTLLGFLAGTHIDIAFLGSMMDDYRIWQDQAKLRLASDLAEIFRRA